MSALQEFITCSVVCMANTLHSSDQCYRVMVRSCRILGYRVDYKQFSENFDNQIKNVTITTYADYLLHTLEKVREIWTKLLPQHDTLIKNGIATIAEKMKKDNAGSWPITDAVYIWPWLHIIAIHLDLNAGHAERVSFLRFIPNMIACLNCRQHYYQHLDAVIESLQTTTCANALLALHTFVNAHLTENETQYKYDINLVKVYFYEKYRKDYFKLMLASNNNKSLI